MLSYIYNTINTCNRYLLYIHVCTYITIYLFFLNYLCTEIHVCILLYIFVFYSNKKLNHSKKDTLLRVITLRYYFMGYFLVLVGWFSKKCTYVYKCIYILIYTYVHIIETMLSCNIWFDRIQKELKKKTHIHPPK